MENEYVYDEEAELLRRLRDTFHIPEVEEIVAYDLENKTTYTYRQDGLSFVYIEKENDEIRINEVSEEFFNSHILQWQFESNKNDGRPISLGGIENA